jgi:hypothetical protein
MVDFEPIDLNQYADNYFDFEFALEDTFFKEDVNNHQQLIYGR